MHVLRITFYRFTCRSYGSLQRVVYRIAQPRVQHEHRIDMLTRELSSTVPGDYCVHLLPVRRPPNHVRKDQVSSLHKRSTHNVWTHK